MIDNRSNSVDRLAPDGGRSRCPRCRGLRDFPRPRRGILPDRWRRPWYERRAPEIVNAGGVQVAPGGVSVGTSGIVVAATDAAACCCPGPCPTFVEMDAISGSLPSTLTISGFSGSMFAQCPTCLSDIGPPHSPAGIDPAWDGTFARDGALFQWDMADFRSHNGQDVIFHGSVTFRDSFYYQILLDAGLPHACWICQFACLDESGGGGTFRWRWFGRKIGNMYTPLGTYLRWVPNVAHVVCDTTPSITLV